MKSSTLFKLGGVLAALIGLSAFAWYLGKPSRQPGLTDAMQLSKITRVQFAGPDGRFELAKSSGAWKMQFPVDYPAAGRELQDALDKLSKLSLSDELSNDPARLEIFGLSSSSATVVRLFAGTEAKPELEFSIGKEGPDWDSFFLQLPGKGAVLAQGLPARDLKRPAAGWLSKTIASVPADQVSRLRVTSSAGRVEVAKTGDAWKVVPNGLSVSTATVESVVKPAVSALAGLEADQALPAKQAPPLSKMGLVKP